MATPERGRICGLSKEVTLAVLPRLHQEELLVELSRRNILVGETYKKDSLVSKLWYIMIKEYQGTLHSVIPEAPPVTGTPSGIRDSATPEQRNLWVSLSSEFQELMETVTSTGGTNTGPLTSTANCTLVPVSATQSEGTVADVSTGGGCTSVTSVTESTTATLAQPSTPVAVSTPHHLPSFTQEVVVETTTGERSTKNQVTSPRRSARLHVLETQTDGSSTTVSNLALIGEAEETYQTPAAATGGKGRRQLRAMGVTRAETHSVGSNTVVTDLGVVGSDTDVTVTDLGAVRELVDGPEDTEEDMQEEEDGDDDVSSDDGEDAGVQMDSDDPDWEPESPEEGRQLRSASKKDASATKGSSSGFAATFEAVVTGKQKGRYSRQQPINCPHCAFTTIFPKTMERHMQGHSHLVKCSECEFACESRLKLLQHMTSHDKTRLFVCKECGYRAKRKERLEEHMGVHTGVTPYKCDQCDFSARFRQALKSHMALKHGAQCFLCEKCGYRTADKAYMRVHKFAHSGEKPCKCPECDFTSCYPSSLMKHMKFSHPGKSCYKCDQCNFIAQSKDVMQEHRKTHELVEHKYKCPIRSCGFSTDDKAEMNPHLAERHGKEKEYSCTLCDHKTYLKGELRQHMKTQHAGEKIFKCTKCEFASSSYETWRGHTVMHSNPKQYVCDKCDFSSASKGVVIRHMKDHGQHPFQCPHCEYQGKNQQNLSIHLGTHSSAISKSEIKCEKCGFIAKDDERMEVHMTEHATGKIYKCSAEGCSFSTPEYSHYKLHLTTHDPTRAFACGVCEYRAKKKEHLADHMRVHTGEKPFKCNLCNYATSLQNALRQHIARHKNFAMPHMCDICGFTADTKRKLNKHKTLHRKLQAGEVLPEDQSNGVEGDKTYQCSHCDFTATDGHKLYLHVREHIEKEGEANNDEVTES